MSPLTDDEVLPKFDSLLLQMIHFFDQGSRIDDDSIADHAQGASVEDPGRNKVKNERATVIDHGVACVRPPLVADDCIGVTGQDVDDFALAFIAPLGAYDHQISHSH
jgi:hypothetical protein